MTYNFINYHSLG